MTDYRDDWKYSKPIPKEPTRRAYEEGWERVFGEKEYGAPFSIETDDNGNKSVVVNKERKP